MSAIYSLSPSPFLQFFDQDGNLLSGGLLFTYLNNTVTKATTYSDATGNTPNTNPIVLDSYGSCNCWLPPGQLFTYVLSPSTDTDPPSNPIKTINNIAAGGGIATINFAIDTGVVNASVASVPGVASLFAGLTMTLLVASKNTGPATLNVNGLGAKPIVLQNGAILAGGELQTGGQYLLQYTGSAWQILGLSVTTQLSPQEIAAGVTPSNYSYAPGNVFRYGAKGDGVTDDSGAINQAALCNTVVYFPAPAVFYGISSPIYIQATAPLNIQFLGQSRTTTMIQPLVANLADGVTAVNTMIFNRQSNGKFSISNLRMACQTVAGFTGIYIYATVGGGADGSGQALFSGSIDNCWFDCSAPGVAGMFQGGMSNYRVSNNTFDAAWKNSIFLLQGAAGGGEIIFDNNVVFNCYDQFISHTDPTTANLLTILNTHVYSHNRGAVFNFSNVNASILIDGVLLQGAAGSTGVGIGTFAGCSNLQVTNCNANASLAGTGPISFGYTFAGCTGMISDSEIDGASIGIEINTTATNRLTFDHVDVVNSLTAAFHVAIATPAGLITASDCNWSDGQGSLVLFTQAASFDFYPSNCRIMNAGLGGGAGSRNLSIATSGLTKTSDCVIGQNNASAAAAYYLDAGASGQILHINPVFVGTPPMGIQNPSAVTLGSIGRLIVAYSPSITFSAGLSDWFEITATNGTAFAINAPTSAMDGKEIRVTIRNTSGGALGALTWASAFKLSAWSSPATTFSRTVGFRFDGTNWIETFLQSVDVPN